MLEPNTMSLVQDVYLLELPWKKICLVFLSGWDFGTYVTNNDVVVRFIIGKG